MLLSDGFAVADVSTPVHVTRAARKAGGLSWVPMKQSSKTPTCGTGGLLVLMWCRAYGTDTSTGF